MIPDLSDIIGHEWENIIQWISLFFLFFTVFKICIHYFKFTSKPSSHHFILEEPFKELPSNPHAFAIFISIVITLVNFIVKTDFGELSINLGWLTLFILGYFSLKYGKEQGLLIGIYSYILSNLSYAIFKEYCIHKVIFNKIFDFDLFTFQGFIGGRYMIYLVFLGYFIGYIKEKILTHQLDNKHWFVKPKFERKNNIGLFLMLVLALILSVSYFANEYLTIRLLIFPPILIIFIGITMGPNPASVFALIFMILASSFYKTLGPLTFFDYINGTDVLFLPILGYFAGRVLLANNYRIFWGRLFLLIFAHYIFHQIRYVVVYGHPFYYTILKLEYIESIFHLNMIVNTMIVSIIYIAMVPLIALILKTRLYINSYR
jgi:hypothetical protein